MASGPPALRPQASKASLAAAALAGPAFLFAKGGASFATPSLPASRSAPHAAARQSLAPSVLASPAGQATSSGSALPQAARVFSVASLAAGVLLVSRRAARRQQKAALRHPGAARRNKPAVVLAALPPDSAEVFSQAHQFLQHAASTHSIGGVDELGAVLLQWANALAAGASHGFVEPAYAADPVAISDAATAAAAAIPAAIPEIVLDPNVKYLFGLDGGVLVDPMNNKPIPDDWWNGFIGIQGGFIKDIDAKLRELGVEQAFGWSIIFYTALVKLLFYPLQQTQLRSTSMMSLIQPKVKDIQEKYKDDPDTLQRLVGQLYQVMDVNPLAGCLPVIIQLPLFWSLYGVWRRLSAEKFEHYDEPWLWVPSLAKPNPDFQFKFDWLLKFKDGAPEMGWHDYLCYLIFPVILVGFTIIQQQQAQAAKPKAEEGKEEEASNLLLQVLPWVSVYFIGSLSLELPQAVSVYYTANTMLTVAQTQFVKLVLRKEIVGYEEFETTGKFPDSAFEAMMRSTGPAPKNLHEAALQGNVEACKTLLEAEGEKPDINGWDEKQIAPLGYAVACGHLETVQFLIESGADVQILDGSDNTLLHYAAGYGHKACLEEIIGAGKEVWPNDEWKDSRNGKGQTVVDAARVNRKGAVVDWLCDRLGLDAEVLKPPAPPALPEPAAAASGEAEVVSSTEASSRMARAALLAAVEAQEPAAAGSAAPPEAGEAAAAMRAAVEKLKSNPEAVEQARKMMGKMPPQLLSMLSGNKLSAEQAQKAMDAMQDMSTEEILSKADTASDQLKEMAVPAASSDGKVARSVD
mmetsp:Transcript_10292/g.18815  ORF Transcript_10292/g.18815 Transcript_10292/m.18815 type:complete len:804 (-) Transcript_10292:22-2433(-)